MGLFEKGFCLFLYLIEFCCQLKQKKSKEVGKFEYFFLYIILCVLFWSLSVQGGEEEGCGERKNDPNFVTRSRKKRTRWSKKVSFFLKAATKKEMRYNNEKRQFVFMQNKGKITSFFFTTHKRGDLNG